MRNGVDTTFGTRHHNDVWFIGNKHIKLDGDNILIDNEIYERTPGFWSIVTDRKSKGYTEDDLERYKELLYETSALHQDYSSDNQYPRASGSEKWKKILRPIWNEFH